MITLVLGLVVLGFLLYLVETKIPMDDTIKLLIRVVIVLGVVYYILGLVGVIDLPLPRVR